MKKQIKGRRRKEVKRSEKKKEIKERRRKEGKRRQRSRGEEKRKREIDEQKEHKRKERGKEKLCGKKVYIATTTSAYKQTKFFPVKICHYLQFFLFTQRGNLDHVHNKYFSTGMKGGSCRLICCESWLQWSGASLEAVTPLIKY